MGKTLVISEKPSVAKDYAKALGERFASHDGYLESDDYVVSWAVGHLVELAQPEDYDAALKKWSIRTLPILPDAFKLKPTDEGRSRKQLTVLKKLMARKDVDMVVNGCDAGREGELIFSYIADWAGLKKPVMRLWVSSMTQGAIKEAFAQLRPGEELANLEAAARSRSEADWLVGMNATRAATVKGRALGGVVSLGRVQTPTLALVVGRDAEIDAFVPETYFQIEAEFALDGERRYTGRWFRERADRTPRREDAEAAAAAARGAVATVDAVRETERKERAPLLYDLTTLQREANSRYGMSAARTLAAAQRLYEGSTAGALLTYPRTRSRFLPADQAPNLKPIAARLAALPGLKAAAEYVAGLDVLPLARVVDDAKVDDHHAIIPTGERPTRPLTGDDARIFDMVVRRYLAVFHPDALWAHTEIVTEAGGETFRTRGKRLVRPGWRAAYETEAAQAREAEAPGEDDEDAAALPKVVAHERGRCERADVHERQTKPPARYTEASLLSAMETAGRLVEDEELREAMKESGLGTPATRAETIEKLLRVGYLERIGKQLRATPKGRQAIGLLGESSLTSAQMTGLWEKRLADIEHGGEARERFIADIRGFTEQVVEHFRALTPDAVRAQRVTIGPCPNGDGEIRENSRAYGCTSWKSKDEPGCGFVIWKRILNRPVSAAEAKELLEKRETGLLDGFPRRPRARLVLAGDNAVQVVDAEGNRLDLPAAKREAIATCPKCGGEIRENSRAYGCSSWKSRTDPGCGFVIWKSQKGRAISPEEAREVIEHGRTGWLDFKDRKGPFRGRLVLNADRDVEIEREDEGAESRAPASEQAA